MIMFSWKNIRLLLLKEVESASSVTIKLSRQFIFHFDIWPVQGMERRGYVPLIDVQYILS